MEAKIKHLEFIQKVIDRMAHNSFLLKGWAITVVGGLLALSFKEPNCKYFAVSLLIVVFFWLLDSYYFWRERLFICLYEQVRKKDDSDIDFSMSIKGFEKHEDWASCATSPTLLMYYGGLILIHFIINNFI